MEGEGLFPLDRQPYEMRMIMCAAPLICSSGDGEDIS